MQIHCFYRLTPQNASTGKKRLNGFSKSRCLDNFLQHFNHDTITICGDNLDFETISLLSASGLKYHSNSFSSGGRNFLFALDLALELSDDTLVYFVEDDFLHRPGARPVLLDGLKRLNGYVTLYDHPDKYLDALDGGNPLVKRGGEKTSLLLGQYCHWKETNSTVMTFATTVKKVRSDHSLIRKYCNGVHPGDFQMFRRLRWRSKVWSAVPGYATHCESDWLSPLFNWSDLIDGKDR